MTTTVLHSVDINGVTVRFFRSHRSGPDFPYVALLDLLSAARFPIADRKLFMENLPREFSSEFASLAVDDKGQVEIVRACSHSMAQGVFGIAEHIGAEDIDLPYRCAAVDAINKLARERGLSEAETFEFSLRAALRGGQ